MAFVGYHANNLPESALDDDWGFVYDHVRSKWEVEVIYNGGTCATGMDLDELLEAAKELPVAPPATAEIADG